MDLLTRLKMWAYTLRAHNNIEEYYFMKLNLLSTTVTALALALSAPVSAQTNLEKLGSVQTTGTSFADKLAHCFYILLHCH